MAMTRTKETRAGPPENPRAGIANFQHPARSPRNARAAEGPVMEPNLLCTIAARLAASHYEVTLADISARTRRSRRATRARHVAMYLAHVVFGINLAAIGNVFGRSRRSAARACGLVEDARDDPAFDAALAGLEISARILLDYEHTEKAA
jgi:hypothetical protein